MLIHEVAKLSGISQRTLRYYDEIKLFQPSTITGNGYRHYSEQDLDKLQQILFYRALDFSLYEIKELLKASQFNRDEALRHQKQLLLQKKNYLNGLIELIDNTLHVEEEGRAMTKEQKFDAFKQHIIDENDKKFGDEVRNRFGEQALMDSQDKLKSLTEEQFEAVQQLEESLFDRLAEAMEIGEVTSEVAFEVAELHKRWLQFYWKKYTKEAHAGLAFMYASDARFIKYYDSRVGEGATQFLCAVIQRYAK